MGAAAMGAAARRGARAVGGAVQPRAARDPVASRQALLSAGRAVFARKGLAGARVAEIAAAARLNKQLVYHYFGSKEQLYQAVLESVYADIRSREQKLSLGDLAPQQALARLAEFSFDYLAENPDFIALLNDENGYGGLHLRASQALGAMHSPLIKLIAGTLRAGVAAGCFRSGIDPLQLYISMAALGYFYFSNTRSLSAIFGRDLASSREIARRRRHVVDFVMAAVRPVAAEPPVAAEHAAAVAPVAARGRPRTRARLAA
jgi:TetR/AcrR family transcriptional regulator